MSPELDVERRERQYYHRVMASFGMLPMRQSASGEPSGTVALAMRWPRPPQTRALLSMGISGRRPEWKVVVCMLVPIAATLTIANIKATLFDTLHASQVKSRWNNVWRAHEQP